MINEAEILNGFRSADPSAALQALFEAYSDRIYRLALGLLGDPGQAEDVVQETYLSAINHRMEFEGRSRLGTWLLRIAYNAAFNRLRQRREDPLPEEDPGEDDVLVMPRSFVEWDRTPEQLMAAGEVRQQVTAAVRSLPTNLLSVFLLRDVEGLSTEDTADALGLSIGAVKVRLHRARLALREKLSDYFSESGALMKEIL
jgi:RNA polymerase sigma-70 factor, ECF subfamily